MRDGEIDITRNVKTIEWLKGELLEGLSSLFRALFYNREEKITDALASVIISSFLLAKRLGISFRELDERVEKKIRLNIEQDHEIEKWYGDLSALLEHTRNRKR